jgi:hypothetical protein
VSFSSSIGNALSGDRGNYRRERDMSLSRGRERKINYKKKKKKRVIGILDVVTCKRYEACTKKISFKPY